VPEKTEFDPNYSRIKNIAYRALGSPNIPCCGCEALLLDRGGDDGYWMRLIGKTNVTYRRVGALLITPSDVGYAETCMTKTEPKSTLGWGVTFLNKEKLVADWTWIASGPTIESVSIESAVASEHGAYVAATLKASGEVHRFGINLAEPYWPFCLSQLYHLSGEYPIDKGSSNDPRTDGVYAFASYSKSCKFFGLYFEDGQAALFSTHDLADAFRRIRDGSWKPKSDPFRKEMNHIVIDDEDPGKVTRVMILDDGKLFYQSTNASVERTDGFERPFGEMVFIPEEKLGEKWGLPLTKTVPFPTWPPLLANGRLVAANLGHTGAQTRSEEPNLTKWAMECLRDAMEEASRGDDFRRIHSSDGGGGGHYTRPVGQSVEQIRRRGAEIEQSGKGWLALITDRVVEGEPCAYCEAYDFDNSRSVVVMQRYRKRMLAIKAQGEMKVLGPAEPFEKESE
jgi:hypothetical protein